MVHTRSGRLDRAVDERRDHVLGNGKADITLLEYASYACPYCHAAHEVVAATGSGIECGTCSGIDRFQAARRPRKPRN